MLSNKDLYTIRDYLLVNKEADVTEIQKILNVSYDTDNFLTILEDHLWLYECQKNKPKAKVRVGLLHSKVEPFER